MSFNFGPDAVVVARGARARHLPPHPRRRRALASPRAATATPSRRRTTTPSCPCATSAIGARRSAGASPTSSAASAAAPTPCGCPRPRSPCPPSRRCSTRGSGSSSSRRTRPRARATAATGSTCRRARIDPTQPYRLHAPSGRALDVFFYDGPISSAIGFAGPARSRRRRWSIASRRRSSPIARAISSSTSPPTVSPTGITRAGASARSPTRSPSRRRAAALSSPTTRAYLAAHPPIAEARLKSGPDGEGTAWSCAHGVGRWTRDCGCSAGTPGFSQAWRAPLRRALDLVRDRAAALFERAGGAAVARSVGRARSLRGRARPSATPPARAIASSTPSAPARSTARRALRALRLFELDALLPAHVHQLRLVLRRDLGPRGARRSCATPTARSSCTRLLSGEDLEPHVPRPPRRGALEPARLRRRRRRLPPPGRAEPRRATSGSPRRRRSCRSSCRARASCATATIASSASASGAPATRASAWSPGASTSPGCRRARPTSSPTPSCTSAPPTSAARSAPPPPASSDAIDAVWREWPRQSIARAGARHRARLRPRRVHHARSAARGAPPRPAARSTAIC